MQISRPMIATASALALAGCAQPTRTTAAEAAAATEPLRSCFQPYEITGYSSIGDNRLYIETGAGPRYLVETLGPCPDLDFAMEVGLRNRGGTAICSAAGLEVVLPESTGIRTCPVRSIREVPRATAR